jgi:hypothetical protein
MRMFKMISASAAALNYRVAYKLQSGHIRHSPMLRQWTFL